MLHPSYTELMERINKDVEEGDTPIVQSRYSIVKATADRAKQIIDARSVDDKIAKQIKNEPNHEPVISDSQHLTKKKGSPLIAGNTDDMKPLSIAIEELYEGYVKISERAESQDSEVGITEEETQEFSGETSAEAEVDSSSENVNTPDVGQEVEKDNISAGVDSDEDEASVVEESDDEDDRGEDDDEKDEDNDDDDDKEDKDEEDDGDKSSEDAEDED